MVGHQAKSVDTEPKALYPLLYEKIEAETVHVIEKNVLSCITSNDNVVACTGKVKSRFSCHASIIPSSCNLAILTPLFTDPPIYSLKNQGIRWVNDREK